MISFLFPTDPFNNKECDNEYLSEFTSLKAKGYNVYLINIDDLEDAKIYPKLNNDSEKLIYRGWMLKPEQYLLLDKKVNNQLKVKLDNYLHSHYLPNWYESIKEFTIDSAIVKEEDAIQTFNGLKWNSVFIKDYVKSLKTEKGSIAYSTEDIESIIKDMKKYRGFIEGGIVMRKVINIIEETEQRFFVLNGTVFSNIEPLKEEQNDLEMKILAEKISLIHNEFFYSIDIVRDNNKKLHVVEIGDGQVSGTVGWNIDNFIKIFEVVENDKENKSSVKKNRN